MRATANFFTRSLLLGLIAWSVPFHDASAHTAVAIAGSELAFSQTSTTQAELLHEARLAMQKGNFRLADQLINQAEKTPPGAGPQQDSPERARRSLAMLQSTAPKRPQSNSANLLLDARLALAHGDLDRTAAMLTEAKRKGITQDATGDSLPAVEQMLVAVQRHNADTTLQGTDRIRRHADLLMDQAEGLMRHGELELAEQLVDHASTLPVRYGANQRTPQMVQNAIAQRRNGNGGANTAAFEQVNKKIEDTRRLLANARIELDRGNFEAARQMAMQANQMRVQLPAGETQPWQLALEIDERQRRAGGVRPAGYQVSQAVAQNNATDGVRASVYSSGQDTTAVRPAQATGPTPAPTLQTPPVSQGVELFRQGLSALQNREPEQALELFREAWQYQGELDAATRRELRDKISLLSTAAMPAPPSGSGDSALEEVNAQEQIAKQQLFQEITNQQKMAEREKESDPIGALNRLETTRGRVEQAEVDDRTKRQFLRIIDADINRLKSFIEVNRADIELTDRNRAVLNAIERDRQALIETQDKLAEFVEQFNILMDERRYAEAEIIAKQAVEIAPNDPISESLSWKSAFARRVMQDEQNRALKEARINDTFIDIDRSIIPMHPDSPVEFPENWSDLSKKRLRALRRQHQRFSPEELEIQQNLKSKVDVQFENTPLDEVLRTLADAAGVPVYIDVEGLAAEAMAPDAPVTIQLSKPVSLRAALNLVLQPLRLSYVVDDEVLKITSETARRSNTYFETYNVADLVIPIPNFAPSSFGLPAAMRGGSANMGFGGLAPGQTSGLPLTLPSGDAATPSSVLAQTNAFNMMPNASSLRSRPTQTFAEGPGGMGGAALADFDTLINLITNTVSPDSWEENGGNGAIEPYPANLSLVISTTQEVHEEIAALLEQLREWQDLQVTIEVRFITLNDNFFERIGIDFDFQIDDNSYLDNETPNFPDDQGPSVAFGLDPTGAPTSDLDIQFLQDGFASAVPQFGGFDATSVSNFGFAILSDIEVFFLMQAATGDRRTNVLAAPRVTLFNGQQANVSDLSLRPFVTAIIPVVGDFAVGQQPVITVLGEGTSLNVQAVVSSDRRFVRLTLVPFFSEIGAVDTFTFTGRTETNTGTNVVDANGDPVDSDNNNVSNVTEGSTVQLPTISFTTVTTTVNVPDGGTVLLGGIKRLSEGRNERGVPMLAQLPYISRLFKNVGIGRDTQSLMLMVTPRIIIQREEEERLVGTVGE